MKIYDISQEVFSCVVYPDDPAPQKQTIQSIKEGSLYNLSSFSMCSHNGTHVDSPFHFIENGKTIDQIPLEKFVGYCYVAEHNGIVTTEDALNILDKADKANPASAKRILIKGKAEISSQAAKVFAEKGIFLIGNESQTVGPENAPMEVHLILLKEEVVLLEGLRLKEVPEGVYLLNSAPLNLSGLDGSPCRAILIDIFD